MEEPKIGISGKMVNIFTCLFQKKDKNTKVMSRTSTKICIMVFLALASAFGSKCGIMDGRAHSVPLKDINKMSLSHTQMRASLGKVSVQVGVNVAERVRRARGFFHPTMNQVEDSGKKTRRFITQA